MANSARKTIYYTPKLTDDEAFELCSPKLREAITISAVEWCCRSLLKLEKKHGTFETLKILKQWNDNEYMTIHEGKGKNKTFYNTTVVRCDVRPLNDLRFNILWLSSAGL